MKFQYNVFFVISSILLAGCSSEGVSRKSSDLYDSLLPLQQQVYNTNIDGAEYKDGYFLLSEYTSELYYINDGASTFVNNMSYADNNPSTADVQYSNYKESIIGGYGFYCLNDKIYSISIYTNKDGAINYNLIEMDLNTKKYKHILQLGYAPDGRFVMNQNNIFIHELDEKGGIIHIYNLSGEEVSTIETKQDVRLFVDGKKNTVYVLEDRQVFYVNQDTNELIDLFQTSVNEYTMFISGNHYLSLEYTYDENQNPISCRSYYRNLETQQIELTFENEGVFQFDDQYIYSSQVSGTQTYKLYDLSGNIVKEIIPSQSLGTPTSQIATVMIWESDYNTVTYVMNGTDIISASSTGPIQCNIESGSCQYLLS